MSDPRWTACVIAPEDLRPGLFIAPLRVITERALRPWECDNTEQAGRIVRHVRLPGRAPLPVRIVDVCLPFVLVQTPAGEHTLIDVRRFRLARIAPRFGRRVFKHLGPPPTPPATGEKAAAVQQPASPYGRVGSRPRP